MKLENLVIASILTVAVGFMVSGQPREIKSLSGREWSNSSLFKLFKGKEIPEPSFVALNSILSTLEILQ